MSGSSRRGATIVEVAGFLLVVSIAVSAAALKVSGLGRQDSARLAAHELTSTIRNARELAIKNDTRVEIVLDRAQAPCRWVFRSADSPKSPAATWIVMPMSEIEIEGTNTPIRIDSSGNASYAGSWTLADGKERYEVVISPIGGQVSMRATIQ